ncbi:MAG: MFS transporter [Burkholderiales bacterium]|nr:MFS transporter [Burkholderiales bacterium]MDE1926671.1 MFS transporter [Burkholderiales bacterium]MDE2158112.1 MFS transporter [Burkholderiales bacterium]MDE2502392.1 MFS transporter [Burkholderiales bacterium]
MRSRSLFQHPLAFGAGSILIALGVLAHGPMFLMGRHTHWRLVGMPMTPEMWIGMAMIPLGLALASYGLLPPRPQAGAARGASAFFHVADGVGLNREHAKLVLVLIITLAIDVMKPATLGFVMPGMSEEYALPHAQAGLLALFALTGTTLGSVLWGRIADRWGRRAAILLSALMFIGTSICGAMPSFEWNLAMCFLMGASAGGLLPITFTLMAETVPARHRGWLLVALGGVGTSAGYLIAAGAAALLEPLFSWRVLWLLGFPTGAAIIFLNRYIPESPRFLASRGRRDEALAVLQRYAGRRTALETDDASHPGAPMIDESHPAASLRQLVHGRHARVTWALLVCGIGWGLANFGFLLWLPSNLRQLGVDPATASALLARSAVLALPGIGVVILMYQRWSSFKSLVVFIACTALALGLFAALALLELRSTALTTAATVALLVSVSGVIAMLIPYAAEIYPVHLRGSGSGLVAASSKFGGIVGAGLALFGFFDHFALSALVIALPMAAAAVLLARSAVETRGVSLEDIQRSIAAHEA